VLAHHSRQNTLQKRHTTHTNPGEDDFIIGRGGISSALVAEQFLSCPAGRTENKHNRTPLRRGRTYVCSSRGRELVSYESLNMDSPSDSDFPQFSNGQQTPPNHGKWDAQWLNPLYNTTDHIAPEVRDSEENEKGQPSQRAWHACLFDAANLDFTPAHERRFLTFSKMFAHSVNAIFLTARKTSCLRYRQETRIHRPLRMMMRGSELRVCCLCPMPPTNPSLYPRNRKIHSLFL
jgi:hypothetical protein